MDSLNSVIKKLRKFGLEYFGFYYSQYMGYVVSNKDPLNQNRLYVLAPSIYGHPSRPFWVYPKGSAPNVHNLPQVGDTILLEFNNGRLTSGVWSYSAPLRGKKAEEFRNEKVYGFKSPGGHLVLIDEIDNLITILHKDGQKILVSGESTTIVSGDIKLTQEDVEEKIPRGNTLDSDLTEVFSELQGLVNNLLTLTTTQIAVCQGPLAPLQPGYQTLNQNLLTLYQKLPNLLEKFKDESHLSEKVRLS